MYSSHGRRAASTCAAVTPWRSGMLPWTWTSMRMYFSLPAAVAEGAYFPPVRPPASAGASAGRRRPVPMLAQEPEDRRVERLRPLEVRYVAGAGDHREPGARDAPRHRLGRRRRVDRVLVAGHDQRRHGDSLDRRTAVFAHRRFERLQIGILPQRRPGSRAAVPGRARAPTSRARLARGRAPSRPAFFPRAADPGASG